MMHEYDRGTVCGDGHEISYWDRCRYTYTITHLHTVLPHSLLSNYCKLSTFVRIICDNCRTYIHTYIYIHICMHTYMHTYIYAYIHACMHAYIHAPIHTFIHIYLHTYIHTYIHTGNKPPELLRFRQRKRELKVSRCQYFLKLTEKFFVCMYVVGCSSGGQAGCVCGG